MIRFKNLENDNRKIIETMGHFNVVEHERDLSVAPDNAVAEYFMSRMGVKRRQVLIHFDGKNTAIVQAGSMQWMAGDVNATTGIKGAGDLFGKMLKSTVTKESAMNGEGLVYVYRGTGRVLLAPVTNSDSLFAATHLKKA